jgi:hypothetical protein
MLRLTLTATLPPKINRVYRLSVAPDLFGMVMVEARFGRYTGPAGSVWQRACPALEAALQVVRPLLLRRLTAPKRLGVAYRLVEVDDPFGLCSDKNARLEALIERLR